MDKDKGIWTNFTLPAPVQPLPAAYSRSQQLQISPWQPAPKLLFNFSPLGSSAGFAGAGETGSQLANRVVLEPGFPLGFLFGPCYSWLCESIGGGGLTETRAHFNREGDQSLESFTQGQAGFSTSSLAVFLTARL